MECGIRQRHAGQCARRVWIDRCTFSDGARRTCINRSLFGRRCSSTTACSTSSVDPTCSPISYNHFQNHDKGLLIGTSDSRADDEGKLRVTMHLVV